jgi:hypothetical protein
MQKGRGDEEGGGLGGRGTLHKVHIRYMSRVKVDSKEEEGTLVGHMGQ